MILCCFACTEVALILKTLQLLIQTTRLHTLRRSGLINTFRSERRALKIWYAHYYLHSVTVTIVIHFSLINIIGLLLLPLPLHRPPLLNVSNSFQLCPTYFPYKVLPSCWHKQWAVRTSIHAHHHQIWPEASLYYHCDVT